MRGAAPHQGPALTFPAPDARPLLLQPLYPISMTAMPVSQPKTYRAGKGENRTALHALPVPRGPGRVPASLGVQGRAPGCPLGAREGPSSTRKGACQPFLLARPDPRGARLSGSRLERGLRSVRFPWWGCSACVWVSFVSAALLRGGGELAPERVGLCRLEFGQRKSLVLDQECRKRPSLRVREGGARTCTVLAVSSSCLVVGGRQVALLTLPFLPPPAVSNLPQQRQDQHHQSTMMHPASAAGAPIVATPPAYSTQYVAYSPQQFPNQPLVQHLPHYQSQVLRCPAAPGTASSLRELRGGGQGGGGGRLCARGRPGRPGRAGSDPWGATRVGAGGLVGLGAGLALLAQGSGALPVLWGESPLAWEGVLPAGLTQSCPWQRRARFPRWRPGLA